MQNSFLKSALLLGIMAWSFTSCQKKDDDNEIQTAPTVASANDDALAEAYFDDIYRQIDAEAAGNVEVNGRTSAGCVDSVVVSPTGAAYPKTMTIYFNATVACSDGRMRSGKIVSTFSGRYREPGTVITTTLVDYYVDGNKIEGTKTITNNGRNTAGNLNYTVDVTDGKITTVTGSTIEWESTRNREWTAGEATLLNIFDDEYVITGSAGGIDRNGGTFAAEITNGLLIKIGCKYITQGTIEFSSGSESFSIDYGNGVCDDNATVTYKGRTYPVTLR